MPARRTLAVALTLILGASCATAPETAEVGAPGEEAAEVVRVLDGDSFVVQIGGRQAEVRLIGINAPERDECFGDEARDQLDRLLTAGTVTLEKGTVEDTDRFGRLLRYVRVDGDLANSAMLSSGHAFVLDTDHGQAAAFAALEDDAFAQGRGLWASDACGPRVQRSVLIASVEADPPGPDTEGEFVELVNTGAASVDMSGWIIRDASSVHRFEFPVGTSLEPGGSVVVFTGCTARSAGLAWCADGPVWNNGGDTVVVQTPEGTVVDRLRY